MSLEHAPEREKPGSGKTRKLISAPKLADKYDVHVSTIWRWVAAGQIPGPVSIGGRTFFDEVEHDQKIEELFAERAA